ncbi:MAG: hypothetical protein KME32_23990 [Mojavia pulchra JT2-VF2]|uniref:Uncharacterized protein n=1 Tax=Mojavia pulchra JT2-VF2 TaxID=287848 RepID=A0A951Q1Q7_9NOST|nr:hypothetical protein [Mojavia pulchra JT2-VF2]
MTSRADEIQRLIADIDNLLANNGKRLSRLLSSQAQEPREVLERIRDFLSRLGESENSQPDASNKFSGQTQLSPLVAKFVDQNNHQSLAQHKQPSEEQNNVVPQKLNSEFSALLQPLQAELAALLQERSTLVQEIRQLEQRRLQNYSLSQQLANQEQVINEFLQVLVNRLTPTLSSHLAHLANHPSSSTTSNKTDLDAISSIEPPLGESSDQQMELLTRLARDLDRRLLSLDGTVNVVFEGLQRNINTYNESLSQALARMHSQGVQGEQLMASFVNNLAKYLQQPLPNPQLSLFGVDNQTVSPSQTSAARADSITNLVDKPSFEFIQPQKEDAAATEDLEAAILQLLEDAPHASETATAANTTRLQPDSSQLDEVDQLYASLFGTNPVVEIEPTQDFNNQLSLQDTAFSPPVSPTNQLQVSDSVVENSLWSEQPNLSLVDAIQDTPEQSTHSTSDLASELWEGSLVEEVSDSTLPPNLLSEEITVTESHTQLLNVDTITALTDLLVDFDDDQQLLAASSPKEVVKTSTVTNVVPKSEVIINDEEQEKSTDNYIPASPQENLLSQAETQANTMLDISLDEEQLNLLDQDLANFDGLLNSSSSDQKQTQSDSSLEIEYPAKQHTVENMLTAAFSSMELPQLNSTSLPQLEAELDFSPAIEKKTEVTAGNSESSLPAISHNLNNTESALNLADSVWYLGIDLGTTGISAALLNRSTFVVHPIYWSAENEAGTNSFQQSFRLPAEVYLPTASIPHGEADNTDAIEQTAPAVVAQEKVPDNLATTPTSPKLAPDLTNTLYSAQLKPYLQIAIPYKNAQQKWEPVLQFNEFSAGPLIWVVRSLSKLLLTLKSDRYSTTQGLTAAAVGLNEKTFGSIINNIAGVICTCPSSWSEQYRFNVREALLTSKVIQHPQQVFFIEEAIASLLSVLDAANGEPVQLSARQGLRPAKISEHPLVGNTLAINIGATATEMALVDLPENLQQFTHNDFMLHSFAYGGKEIEQDIICQLLLPPKSRQSRAEIQGDSKTSSNPWLWQSAIPGLERMQWHSLGLEELELPRVGEPDITARVRLQQRLESSLLGQAVLDAALALKLILQHQDSFTLDLADQRWVLQRRDLESQVLVPFVRRLNRELNKLLVARGIPTEAINQAILTGGVASIETVNRWLKQKLPNAKIIQDSYLGDNGAPNCSRVAYGLAMLPLHPQVLEIPRQQYTDYFLFTELLRLLPDRSLSFDEVIQLFEGRGINTRACQQRLLAFLEGELPPGLIPNSLDSTWLAQSSHENSDYQAIAAAPLFEKQGNLTYRPNSQQLLSLRSYLDAIQASTQQSLEEPYTVNFALEVAH